MKDSSMEEIENVGTDHLKNKIEGLEYENNQLKEMVQTQMAAMAQRNSEIESLVNLVKGILVGDGADSKGEDKMTAIRGEGCADRLKEGDSSPKCDAGLELLRDLIFEMSHEMAGLRMHRPQVNELFGLANARAHQIEEQVEQIIELKGEVSRRENWLATANEKLVVLERELVNEQKKTELLEMWARKKDNKIESLTCEVQRLVNGKTQISEEVKHLREELAAANVKIDRLQEDNCQKEKRILEVERRLEDLANKFEERSAKLKMEGQEERLREERHSGTELCREIEAYKQQMIAELEHSKRRTKEASKEKLETSATLRQSSFGKEIVIELGRLKEQLCFRKESKTPRLGGHVEMLATEDPKQLRSSGETDKAIDITECFHDKDLQEVLGSKDRGMQSLSEVIDHLLILQRTEENDDAAAVVKMVAKLRKQKKILGFSKEDMANKAHIDVHIHVLNRARGKDVQTQLDKILECMCQRMCQSQPATEDVSILQNTILPAPTQEEKDRSDAAKMVADLRNQKRLLGFMREDMAMKGHLDTHIHVLNRARGKDIHTTMNNILECMCQSKLAAEGDNILESNILSAAPQEEEVLFDPKYSTDELISTQEEVLTTKQETLSIPKEVLGTSKTIISSEDFIFISEDLCLTPQAASIVPEDLCLTPQAASIVPEDLCLTPQAAPIVPDDLCLTPQAAPIVQKELFITKQRDAFHVEGAAISGDEQALHNDREALNMERLAQIREKEAFASEREAFYREKEIFDEGKDAFQREMATFYREKEEFHMKNEAVDREKEEFHMKKEAVDREKEEFHMEKEALEREKQALDTEKEKFHMEKEVLDRKREVLDREKEALDREKEEFDKENKEREHQLQDFNMEKETSDREKEEFHEEKEALDREKEEFHVEKEALDREKEEFHVEKESIR
ncbi:calponin homology domain-containing protein DDB_G0272472-like [Macrobrachium nipponense]|uniref:calponin homology domain-containing protein DDB_G0272472-like n=1 Tax=Macrobrachium nipponense TaxID=159736 RepID=UPI0030C85AD6